MVSPAMEATMLGTMYFLWATCAQHGGGACGGGLICASQWTCRALLSITSEDRTRKNPSSIDNVCYKLIKVLRYKRFYFYPVSNSQKPIKCRRALIRWMQERRGNERVLLVSSCILSAAGDAAGSRRQRTVNSCSGKIIGRNIFDKMLRHNLTRLKF